MRFALLSELELRLVDRMFDAGVFRDVPAVIPPPTELGAAEHRIRTLAPLASQVEATAQHVGGVVEHASIDELLRTADRSDCADRRGSRERA